MFCLLVFPTMFLPADGRHSSDTSLLVIYHLLHPFFINIFIMESTLLTVAMSLERFMAICFPLRQDLYLTTRRIKYVIAFTVVFSIAFNVPVLFRYEVTPHCGFLESQNFTFGTTDMPSVSTSSIGGMDANLSPAGPAVAAVAEIPSHKRDSNRGARYQLTNVTTECTGNTCESIARTLNDKLNILTTASTPYSRLAFPKSPSGLSSGSHGVSLTAISTASEQQSQMIAGATISTALNDSLQPLYYTIEQIKIGGSDTVDNAYRWAWAVAGNFVPLILLFYFNVCLWWKIYLSYKMRRQFHRPNQTTRSSHILTVTLVAIVLMFFILVAPTETVLALKNNITMERATATAIEDFMNLLQTINFSVNFILYCIISPYFRKTLKYIMLCGLYNIYQVSKDWKKEFETSLM